MPWPDFQIQHECRNFNKLVEWADSRKAHLKAGSLLNPYFRKGRCFYYGLKSTNQVRVTEHDEPLPTSIPTALDGSTELVGGTRLAGTIAEDDY